MYEEWSNNACRGYVIKAMENCGFHAKEIQQVLIELYEVFPHRDNEGNMLAVNPL